MIELIVLDVDGTLTDGGIIYSNSGEELKSFQESKAFDVKDGLAVASWTKKMGKKAAIITGRNSLLVEKKAKELGVTYIFQGVDDKDRVLKDILEQENLTWDNVAAIGDDLNDLRMLKKVSLSFAPNDAVEYIKKSVNVVCQHKGGKGAVREMIEYILEYDDQKGLETLWE